MGLIPFFPFPFRLQQNLQQALPFVEGIVSIKLPRVNSERKNEIPMPLKLDSRLNSAKGVRFDVGGLPLHQMVDHSINDIESWQIQRGNQQVALQELFAVSGDATDGIVEITGNLASVDRLGCGMTGGQVVVRGSVGHHLGAKMRGGQIVVHGDVGQWCGAEMKGGLVHVHGNVDDHAGSAYRASPRGMTGGTLLIDGNAGNQVGVAMRRGLIAVGGDCGDLAGQRMLAGTIVIAGRSGKRHGAEMRRGTIVHLGDTNGRLLPTFQQGYRGKPPAIGLVLRELARLGFPLPENVLESEFDLFHGDMLQGGRGEVFVQVS